MTNTLDTGLVDASTAAASAGFMSGGGGDCNSGEPPACKQTGTSNSSHTDQSESYSGPLMCGTLRKCIGKDGKITPRWPRATARLISAIAASTGQIGTRQCGMKRSLALAHSSISQSL